MDYIDEKWSECWKGASTFYITLGALIVYGILFVLIASSVANALDIPTDDNPAFFAVLMMIGGPCTILLYLGLEGLYKKYGFKE